MSYLPKIKSSFQLLLKKEDHQFSIKYFKQVKLSFIVKLLSVLISLIYIPIVLDFLDKEKYGIWITIVTIVNWLRLMDIGMGNGMRNSLSESIAKGNLTLGKTVVSTTYLVLTIIFSILLVIFLSINHFFNWQKILNTTILSSEELFKLTQIAVSFIIISFILQPIIHIYTAHGNSVLGGIIQLTISAISLLLIWLATILTPTGNIIILATILTGVPLIIYALLSIYTFVFKYPELRPSFKSFQFKSTGNLMKLSSFFFLQQITSTVVFSSIPFVITQLFDPNAVTEYNIAFSIFNLPIILINLISTPILPFVTQSYARKDFHWIKAVIKKQISIAIIIIGGTVLMIFISPVIYKIWLGDRIQIPLELSLAVGVYAIIQVINNPLSNIINGTGKIKLLAKMSPIFIAAYLGFAILLSRQIENVIAIPIALAITSIIGILTIVFELKRHIYSTKT